MKRIQLLCTLMMTFFATGSWAGTAVGAEFVMIVHPKNPISALDRRFLADLYFKKITHWPQDGVVQPVDQRVDAAIRQRFSEEILQRSVMGIKSYWQQLIFSGRGVPPPELKTDEEVREFVIQNPGSIGYVSGSANLRGVRVIGIK